MRNYNHELKRALCTLDQPWTREEDQRLYELMLQGDCQSADDLITNSIPLVISLVEKYLRQWPQYAHLRDDLVASGFLAAVKAVRKLAEPAEVDTVNPSAYIGRSVTRVLSKAAQESPVMHPPKDSKKACPAVVSLATTRQPYQISTADDYRAGLARHYTQDWLSKESADQDYLELRDLMESCCRTSQESTLLARKEQGYTFAEIAHAMGEPKTSVIRSFHGLRKRIRAKLESLK